MTAHTLTLSIENDSLAQVLKACAPLIDEHAPELETLRADLLRQHRERRPEILVHGAYNAGKSTLINALLGEERAAVRDIPTTATIDRYDFGRLVLVDTPGVNAPMEHEAVTEQALKPTQRVMFVVREGNHDDADQYRRLFRLLEEGRSVLVVLNHQAAEEEIEQLRNRLLELLVSQADTLGVDDALLDGVAVVPVNAPAALKGQLEAKPLLVEASGLDDLRLQLGAWLEQVEAKHPNHLAKRAMNDLLQPLQSRLQGKLDGTGELNQVNQQLGLLGARLDRLQTDLRTRAAAEVQRSKAAIGEAVDLSIERPEAADSRCQQIAEGALQELIAPLDEGMKALGEQLESSHRAVALPAPDMARLLSGEQTLLGNMVSMATESGTSALKQLGEDQILGIMKALRAKKILFKGRWEKTLARWAGKTAIAVQVAAVVLEGCMELRAQNQHNADQRSAVLNRQQIIEEIALQIHGLLDEFIGNQLAELRNRLLEPLHDEQGRLAARQGDAGRQLQQLAAWTDAIRPLVD